MRKRSAYRAKPKTPPMLINRGMIEHDIETKERMTVEAFAGGWADTSHFDTIADMRNVLMIASSHKNDQQTVGMCNAISVVMANARARYAQSGRMGLTGDELKALRAFVDTYRDFWIRQPVSLYVQSCDALDRAHSMGIVKESHGSV